MTHFIGVWHKLTNDRLVLRLLQLEIDPVDLSWVRASIEHNTLADSSTYTFSHLSNSFAER